MQYSKEEAKKLILKNEDNYEHKENWNDCAKIKISTQIENKMNLLSLNWIKIRKCKFQRWNYEN